MFSKAGEWHSCPGRPRVTPGAEAAEDFRRADQVAPIVAELERQCWTPPAPGAVPTVVHASARGRQSDDGPRRRVLLNAPIGLVSPRVAHHIERALHDAAERATAEGVVLPPEVAEFLVDVRRPAGVAPRPAHRYLPDHLRNH